MDLKNILNTENINVSIKDINNKLEMLKNKDFYGPSVYESISGLLSLKSPGIYVFYISYKENDKKEITLELTGQAKSREDLQKFKDTLSQNDKFKNVNLPISSFVKKNSIDFNISLNLNN